MRRVFISFCLLIALAAGGVALGQTLDEVRAGAKAELDQALQELAKLQAAIGAEKIPLARKLGDLEESLAGGRRELDRRQRSQENQLVELNVLKAEVRRLREEQGFVSSLMGEYARLFETRIHISEVPTHREAIERVKAAAVNADLAPSEKLGRQSAILTASLARIENVMGGATYEGQALSGGGRMVKGSFALLGPIAYFAGAGSGAVGLADIQLGSSEASVIPIDPSLEPAIRNLIANGKGDAPVDASLGNALRIAATKDSLVQHYLKGGVVMHPMLLLAVAATLVAIFKWLQISRFRPSTPRDLQVIITHLNEGSVEKAKTHASGIAGPAGDLLKVAVENSDKDQEYLEEVLYENMLNVKPKLERLLPFIALTSASAPLLGLLGTVTGMISTFNMISVFGTGDPRTLSGGISEALITTEFGLVIAIPALFLHAILSRKIKALLGNLEQSAVAFINGAPAGVKAA
jgi:biopolymer transport protein ExbB